MLLASGTMALVPHLGKGSLAGPARKSLVNCLERARNSLFSAGLRTGRLPASIETYLRPLLPMTAPSPPRPAWRAGRRSCSESVQATEAPDRPISPAGPTEMNDVVFG